MSQFYNITDYDSWFSSALEYLRLYGISNDRHIYLLKNKNIKIGFALTNRYHRYIDEGVSLAEFFIDKDFENMGFGRQLAEHVFSSSKGNWEIAVAKENIKARSFWRHLVAQYTNGKYKELQIKSYEGYGFVFSNA